MTYIIATALIVIAAVWYLTHILQKIEDKIDKVIEQNYELERRILDRLGRIEDRTVETEE